MVIMMEIIAVLVMQAHLMTVYRIVHDLGVGDLNMMNVVFVVVMTALVLTVLVYQMVIML